MAGSSNALEAVGLTKRYGRRVVALEDVSLRVPSGSITALVGPNAAGKSTLMRTWVGFERPSTGSVRVFDVDPWSDRTRAIEMLAYVPQQPALYRSLSAAEHLDMGSHSRRAFDSVVASSHLASLDIPLNAKPTQLSGGQQAQLALAIALGSRARVLILDEPLASLDPLARSEFLELLGSAVRREEATAVLSSHIIADIEQACDHLIVLGTGRVLLDASIRSIMGSHFVHHDGAGAWPDTETVATVRDESDGPVWLVRALRPGSQVAMQGLIGATLDQVVKGYLLAGRLPAPRDTG